MIVFNAIDENDRNKMMPNFKDIRYVQCNTYGTADFKYIKFTKNFIKSKFWMHAINYDNLDGLIFINCLKYYQKKFVEYTTESKYGDNVYIGFDTEEDLSYYKKYVIRNLKKDKIYYFNKKIKQVTDPGNIEWFNIPSYDNFDFSVFLVNFTDQNKNISYYIRYFELGNRIVRQIGFNDETSLMFFKLKYVEDTGEVTKSGLIEDLH